MRKRVTRSNDVGKKIQTGVFAADMKVELINDRPVTIVIDTKNRLRAKRENEKRS